MGGGWSEVLAGTGGQRGVDGGEAG